MYAMLSPHHTSTHTGLTVTKARSRMHTMLSPHHTSTHTGLTVTKARSRMHTMLSPHHTSTHTQALQWPRPGPVCIQCSARIIHLHTHRPYSDQGPVPYAYNAQPASYIYTHTDLTVTKARSRMHTMLSPHHTSTHTQALQWPRPGPVCIQCSARIIHLHTHRPYSDQGPVPYAYNAQPASYIYTHTGLTVTKARSRMHTMLSPHHTSTHTQTLQWPRPGPVCIQCSARIIHLHTHRPYSDQGPVPYAYNAQPASYIYTHTQALQWPRPGPVCIQCSARIIHLHTHTGLTVTKARSRMHTMLSPHHTSTHTQALQWPRPGPVCIQCSARIIHLHTHRPYSDQGPVPYAYNAQPASYIYTHTGLTVTKARSRMHTMLSPHHTSTHTQALQWPRPGPVCIQCSARIIHLHTQALQWPRPGPVCIQCSARIIHLHTHRPYSDQGPVPYAYNAQPASYIYTHTGLTVTKARSRMHTMLSPHHTSTHTQALQWPRPGPVCIQCSARIIHLHTHTDLTVTKARSRMHTMLSPHHTSTHTQTLQWPRPGPVCIQCSARIIHLHTHRPYSDQGPVPYAYNAQPASYIYTHTGLTVTKARSRMHTMLSPHHTSTHTQALQWPRPGPVCIQCSARIIHLHTHRPYSDQGPVPYAYNAQPASYIYTHTGLTVTKARSRMHTMLSPHHTSTHTQALQWPRPGPVCIQCSARIIHLHTHRPYSDQGPVPYAYNAQPASYIYTHTQALQWPRPGPVCIQCSARIIHLHTHRPYSDQGPVPYAYNAQPASYIYTHRPYSDQGPVPYAYNAQPASYIYTHTDLTVTKARSRMHTMLSPHHTSTHTQALQWPRPGPVCIQCSARIIHLHTHRPYSDQGPVPYAYNAQPASYIYTHTGLTVTKARSRMHTMLSPHHTSTHTQALQWPRPGPVCIQCSARIIHLHTHRPYSDQGPVPYAYNAQPASYIYTHTDAARLARVMQTCHSGEALAVLPLSCSSSL